MRSQINHVCQVWQIWQTDLKVVRFIFHTLLQFLCKEGDWVSNEQVCNMLCK